MPDSNTNTQQQKDETRNLLETTSPPTALLRFHKTLIILAHTIAFAAALLLSFLVANNMQFSRSWLVNQYPPLLLLSIVIKLLVFGFFKQYRGWWRYVSVSDLVGILRASVVSTLIIVGLWFGLLSLGGLMGQPPGPQKPQQTTPILQALQDVSEVPQGVFMADLFGTFLLMGGLRMVIRLYYEEFRTVEAGRLKRFLIVGAGNAGEALLREIHRMPIVQYEVVGFIDDDPTKQGINIHGIPVLGAVEQLPKICANRNIEEIAIAMPSATHQQLRRVIQVCEGTKIRFRTVPSITDIAAGKYRVSQIRDVDINDLLGDRKSVV